MASLQGAIDATHKPFHGPWEGEEKIVIGIDIGTTQSGVAFTYLQGGANQAVHRVTRWPGQEAHNQQGKIPTLVWYNANKKAVSFGAEAMTHDVEEEAEDNGWFLAKYFKLHMHPDDMRTTHDLKLNELPPGVPLRQIYSDFMGYLLKHTKTYFEDRILDGKQIWERLRSTMEVAIAHPNGWGIHEQNFLRTAAVDAGLAGANSAPSNIRFVTEAEASVHFCIYHTNLGNRLQPGTNFLVCDAGGSTVDTTLYSVKSTHPILQLEEKRASACVQAGAIFIDTEAKKYLEKALTSVGLPLDDVKEYTKAGVKDFENHAKRAFRDETSEYTVSVAHSRFNNASIQTRRGRMTLPGSTMKSFFDICTEEIISSVDEQVRDVTVPYILLVGGFGDSHFLRQEFKKQYERQGCQVTLTNDSTSKAVADGAVIWNTVSSVSSRAPRSSFGVICAVPFLPWDQDHREREAFPSANGQIIVPGAWSQIVSKGVALDSDAVCRETYVVNRSTPTLNSELLDMSLIAYSGDDEPVWAWERFGVMRSGFRKVCTINAGLDNLGAALERRTGIHGKTYWSLACDVCIRFGGTELEAYLEWKEQGVTRTSPVTIVTHDLVEV